MATTDTVTDTGTGTARVRRRLAARIVAGAALGVVAAAAQGQLAPLGTGIAPSRPGGAQALTFKPGIRGSETVSDNILLLPRGQEQTGTLTEVSPYVRASASTGRAQGALDYSLIGLYRTGGGDGQTTIRHSLTATGNALLIGDSFGIMGNASNLYANTSAFGTLSPNPTLSTVNTSRVTTVTLAPYLVGRMGSFANYSAQYGLTRTDTSDNAGGLLSARERRLYANLTSGPQFVKWGWSVYAESLHRDVYNSPSLGRRTAAASVYYVFSPELRAGGSINYSYVEGATDGQGRSSGLGPGAFVDWSPSRRTTVRASWSDQFYGSTMSVAATHARERWIFGLNYTRALLTSSNSALMLFNPGALFSAGAFSPDLNVVYQQLLSQGLITPNTLLATGLINDSLVRTRYLNASVGYSAPKFSVSITGFNSMRDSLFQQQLVDLGGQPISFAFGRIESLGLTATGRITVTPRSSLTLTMIRTENKSLDDGRQTRLTSATASLGTQLTTRSNASLMFRRTVQSGDNGVTGYDENAVVAIVNFLF